MTRARLTTLLLGLVCAGALVVTGLRIAGVGDGPWPIAPIVAFTPYLPPIAVVIAAGALVLRRRAAAVVLVACAVVVGLVVGARERPADQPAASSERVRITTANLLHGRADPRELAKIVERRRPDVLALQEVSPQYLERLDEAGGLAQLPHRRAMDGTTWHDTGLASRWPLGLRDAGLPSVYLAATTRLPSGRLLPLVSAHPTPPILPAADRRWERWLRALPGPRAGALAGGLVAGDFNATLDHPEFQDLLARGWRDAGREAGEGLTPTWRGAGVLRLTIDHVLVPPGAAVVDYAVDDLPGSDHRAVTVTVALPAADR